MLLRLAARASARGHRSRTIHILRAAVQLLDGNAVARIRLAQAAANVGDQSAFAEAFPSNDPSKALQSPMCAVAVVGLYLQQDEYAIAARLAQMATERFPDSHRCWSLRAEATRQLDEQSLAVSFYEEAIRVAPTPKTVTAELMVLIGYFESLGSKSAANEAMSRLLALDPTNAWGRFRQVAINQKWDAASEVSTELLDYVSRPSTPIMHRSFYHNAIGTLCHRSHKYDDAFAHFSLSNKFHSEILGGFDVANLQRASQLKRELFDASTIKELSQHGCQDDLLLCIVGMPRSGTTLAAEIIASFPGIANLGERSDFFRLTVQLPSLLKSRLDYPQCCRQLTGNDVNAIAQRTRDRLRGMSNGHARVVTKLPGDCFELGLISILFPKVKIIHCCRNPMDVCWSNFMQSFNAVTYSTDLRTLGAVYDQYLLMMEHWKSVLPAGAIHELVYEDLVSDPDPMVRKLCEFCDIEFDSRYSNFFRRSSRVDTCSNWQVRQPIYTSSVTQSEPYRKYLGLFLQQLSAYESSAGHSREKSVL